ncbi:complement C1q tumor necrosis factor-related protein 3-like [Archocentrus centrarchus]|uniref:complement C1q tumor necrosis factor-related protein 3-like n=1 Tax=Archocentrus centrarchus TaxID=63155 RepID=UPI0011EA038A|nr:complement C1q tumor necrosis factor-related protein 3-like [Archocentrus centrarchus]
MEIIVFFSLLLLVCCVPTNQTAADSKALDQQISNQQDIHAVLRELTASLAEQKVKIANLEKENQVKQVAFSASLLDQGDGGTGPFNTQVTLIFKHVVTNIGNAYNSGTGIFTAPVRGVYHFEWKVYGFGNTETGAVLFRNGDHIYVAYEHPSSGAVSASNAASLLLEAGDQVSVRLWANSRIHDNQNHHTTFSGHLIFTM